MILPCHESPSILISPTWTFFFVNCKITILYLIYDIQWKYKEVQTMDANLLFDGFITVFNLLFITVGPILVKNAIHESRDS